MSVTVWVGQDGMLSDDNKIGRDVKHDLVLHCINQTLHNGFESKKGQILDR